MRTLALALLCLIPQDLDGDKAIVHVDKPPAKHRPGTPLSMLLVFHGANGNANSLIPKAEEMLTKSGVREDWVVVGLKSKEVGWTDKDDEPVKAFVPWALKKYGADPRRVFGFGVSSGAWFLNRFAPKNSELLAGAVSYVGGMGQTPQTKDAKSHAELYWIIGHKDDTLPPSRTRPQAEAYFKAGFRAVYHEMLDLAHEGPREPTQSEAVEWLGVVRNKRLAPVGDEAEFLKKFDDESRSDSALSTGVTWMKLASIGGPAAAPVVLRGLASERAGVRSNAAQTAAQVLLDDKVVDALIPLLDDKDVKVRRTALTALVFQGRWNYPQAQLALCAFVKDEKRSAADRKAAATGLAEIAKLDLLGTWMYKDVIWTLVGLLGDKDGGLRSIAFTALQPVQADGFGYNPAMAEGPRAKSLQAWKDWCTKTCGAQTP